MATLAETRKYITTYWAAFAAKNVKIEFGKIISNQPCQRRVLAILHVYPEGVGVDHLAAADVGHGLHADAAVLHGGQRLATSDVETRQYFCVAATGLFLPPPHRKVKSNNLVECDLIYLHED